MKNRKSKNTNSVKITCSNEDSGDTSPIDMLCESPLLDAQTPGHIYKRLVSYFPREFSQLSKGQVICVDETISNFSSVSYGEKERMLCHSSIAPCLVLALFLIRVLVFRTTC